MNFLKTILLVLFAVQSIAQKPAAKSGLKNMTREEYIETYSRWAVWEMYEYNIPASITIAQGILESGSGNSELSKQANNHFGIKCHKNWEGLKFYMDDDTIGECFRVYPTALESFRDHSLFLRTRSRYSPLFELDRTDFEGWARGLKAAGYATNPKYADMLIQSIEDFDLFKFDLYPDPRPKADKVATATKIKGKGGDIVIENLDSVYTINGRKCVKINSEFSVTELSAKYGLTIEKLYKYNDIASEEMLDTGLYFFLEKKQNYAVEEFHKVKPGESMFQIAQLYGVKLQKLYDLNKMAKYMQPLVEQVLNLKNDRDSSPFVRTYYDVITERNLLIEEKKQRELKRRAGVDKALAEQRYRLQIEALKVKNQEEEIKISDLQYQIQKLKEEQEKYKRNKEYRAKEIEKMKTETEEKPVEKVPEFIQINTGNPNRPTDTLYKAVTRTNPKTGMIYHVVGLGETLYSLARKYSVTVEEIKSWNGLEENALKLGQELMIDQKK
jgi:LysM repeat protein